MSDLEELRRRRAQLREQLQQLELEIAEAEKEKTATAKVDPDALLEQWRSLETKDALPSKAGCWGALAVLLLLIGGAVAAIAHFFYR
jgi:hypothetical protein